MTKTSACSSMLHACEKQVLAKDSERKIMALERKSSRQIVKVGLSRRKRTRNFSQMCNRKNSLEQVTRGKLQLMVLQKRQG